jgi:hypothetical protein
MLKAHPIDQARALLERRLADIEEERKRLERALGELGHGLRRPRRRGPKKAAAGARRASAKKRRPGRKGQRADQVLAAIDREPGIRGGEIAKSLKVHPNYVYRVIGDLKKEGKITKKGRQLFVKS